MNNNFFLIETIKKIHFDIVKAITTQVVSGTVEQTVADENVSHGDVSYAIDIEAESIILNQINKICDYYTVRLIMEGMGEKIISPGKSEIITIIIDPIDGTREIMYDKRSAWILTGISFAKDPVINDIEIAIQTEIPISKQNHFSHLFACRGNGAFEEIYDKDTFQLVKSKTLLSSSKSDGFKDGYICFPNPFPGIKETIAKRYEKFYANIFPNKSINDAKVFADEYISTGGHIYLLATGRYRLVADIRDFVQIEKNSLCCHPYDLCTVLIAIEAGCKIVNLDNESINYPLDVVTNCNWIGFANLQLYNHYQALLFESIFIP